jgi:hypothetical protein
MIGNVYTHGVQEGEVFETPEGETPKVLSTRTGSRKARSLGHPRAKRRRCRGTTQGQGVGMVRKPASFISSIAGDRGEGLKYRDRPITDVSRSPGSLGASVLVPGASRRGFGSAIPALRLVGGGRVHAEPGGSPRGPLGRALATRTRRRTRLRTGSSPVSTPERDCTGPRLSSVSESLGQDVPQERGAWEGPVPCGTQAWHAPIQNCMHVHAWLVTDGDGGSDAGVPPLGGTLVS